MYKITKEFSFCASHTLNNLPANHPCQRLHGHNFVVIVELQSATLNEQGMVIDYRKLDRIKSFIDNHFDHNHLNEVMECSPTAENLAQQIFEMFDKTYPQLSSVTVKEDNTRSVQYTPEFETKKLSGVSIVESINKNML